jgi:uncharacterized protein with beta-barrel porin domain
MQSVRGLRAWARPAADRRFRSGRMIGRAISALACAAFLVGTASAQNTYTVTDLSDNVSDTGSLRYAITQANANPGSTINFAVSGGGTITLASDLPTIEANVTINGQSNVTVSGANSFRIFFVDQGNVSVSNLTVANGVAHGGNGGAGTAGGGGGLGAGGALFVNQGANVSLHGVAFQSNQAVGGAGGTGNSNHGTLPLSGGGGGGLSGNGGNGSLTGNAGGGGGGLVGNGVNAAGANGGAGGGPNGGAGGTAGGSGTNGQPGGTGGGGGGAGQITNGGNGGDFGGGGGQGQVFAGKGGFGGGGGGGYASSGPTAGFGGGNGGGNAINGTGTGGNGGSGYGGAIFVRTGGSLTVDEATTFASDGVTAGTGGASLDGGSAGQAGAADGTAMYLTSNTVTNLNINSGWHFWSETISGTGGILKSGAGTLELTGNNNYTGPTEVATGQLNIDGTSSSNTTVDPGAILGGLGTITGNVTNNGIVAPGFLTVVGDYNQSPSAILQIQTNPPGNVPGNTVLLCVEGNSTLAGTVSILAAPGTYATGVQNIFFETNNRANTEFSNLTLTGLPTMHAEIGYGTTVVGGLTFQDAFFTLLPGSNFAAYATTPNQLAVLSYIDANSTDPALLNLVTALASLSPSGVQNAADQMSGALYGSVAQTDFQSSTLELSFISNRIANGLTCLARDSGQPANASAFSNQMGTLASSGGSDLTVRGQNSYLPLGRPASGWSSWGFGYGLGGNAQGNGNAAGLNYSLGGTVAGIESIDDNKLHGLYVGYVGSHLGSYIGGQSVSVNGGQLGFYRRVDDGRNYYILLGGMGADGYNSRRLMNFGGINATASANYGGWQSQLYLERGITMQSAVGSIQPYAALQYLYVRQNSFTETGAGVMNLGVSGIDANSLRSLIGIRLACCGLASRMGTNITPVARALWLHEFLGTSTGINAQFAPIGGSNFAVTGTSLGRDWAILGAGLNWNLGGGWQAYANYDAQVNIVQTFHVGSGGFQYTW